MQVPRVLSEVQHRKVKLWATGDRLRFSPASALTPELIDGLRENKEYILRMLDRRNLPPDPRPRIGNVGEVLELARKALPELKEEDWVDLDELIQANNPPPGRAPSCIAAPIRGSSSKATGGRRGRTTTRSTGERGHEQEAPTVRRLQQAHTLHTSRVCLERLRDGHGAVTGAAKVAMYPKPNPR